MKRDCPTCVFIAPVLADMRERSGLTLTIYSQDDPLFPESTHGSLDDTDLVVSFALNIEAVPTLLRFKNGVEVARTVGWSREHWEEICGVSNLGVGLAPFRPGCGSRTQEPAIAEAHDLAAHTAALSARWVSIGEEEDEFEAMFDRGWSDGLPLVPPTTLRVARMLAGTNRAPHDIVAVVPPNLVECTVEKVAINAVMAGCRPDYLPVVLAAVEASCTDTFNMHGLLATTYFSGPVVIVNGPISKAIGMNSGINALGQGNRANATIGRALQLVIRNVGGGRPGGIDRATLGQPGKYTFCFAEHEGTSWGTIATERGFTPTQNVVTIFAGEGVRGVVDQLSRTPESLTRSIAECLLTTAHPKLAVAFDAMLIISPEHLRVFEEGGWSRQRFRAELEELLLLDGGAHSRGSREIMEGMPEELSEMQLPKFRERGLLIAHAGGAAGLFSAIVGGWVGGSLGSESVTLEIDQ